MASVEQQRAPAVPVTVERTMRPVMFWALVGAGFLLLMVYEWGSAWLAGDLVPTTAGRETAPAWATISVRAQEIALGVLALVVIWLVVIRPWRREGHITLDGMMVISWATMWAIQDPWVSYSQTTISYNSTAVNLGCPQCHAPGWQSSQALAEPIIWGLGCYIGPMYLATLLAGKLMSRARERWPRTGKFGLTMIAIGSLAVADLVLEVFWTRTGVYTYGGGHPAISLFDEHYYKYPLWVGAIWGVAWGLIAAVRFFRDDRGHTVAERGINRVNTTPRRKQLLRLLALIGIMNSSFAFVYNVPVQIFSMHAHAFPQDLLNRPYLLGGVCGAGTDYACPDARIPIPRGETSARITPEGTLHAPNGLPDQLPR